MKKGLTKLILICMILQLGSLILYFSVINGISHPVEENAEITYTFSDQDSSLSTFVGWTDNLRTQYSRNKDPLSQGRGGYYWEAEDLVQIGYCSELLGDGWGDVGFEIFNFPVNVISGDVATLIINTDTPSSDSWFDKVSFDVYINDEKIGEGTSADRGNILDVAITFSSSVLKTGNNNIYVVFNEGTSSYGQLTNVHWVSLTFNGITPASALTLEWNKTFGGLGRDLAKSVIQTTDGGFILAGYTNSYGAGSYDIWLVKTDQNGNEEWSKTFGGEGSDSAKKVIQAADNGLLIVGDTTSYGAGSYDIWLVKTDEDGDLEWNVTFGAEWGESPDSGIMTADNGFIVCGDKWCDFPEQRNMILVKIKSNGTLEWEKTYHHGTYDEGHDIVQTEAGGYVVAGETGDFGTGGTLEEYKLWLVKTDSNGTLEWDRVHGGSGEDRVNSVIQSSSGDYIIVGSTDSYGSGSFEAWVVTTDSTGLVKNGEVFSGTNSKSAYSIIETTKNDLLVVGSDSGDAWFMMKNQEGEIIFDETFGGDGYDVARSVLQITNDTFIATGYSSSYSSGDDYDFWLMKLKIQEIPLSSSTTSLSTTITSDSFTQDTSITTTSITYGFNTLIILIGIIIVYFKRKEF
ncbi:MAG: hypothetical protein ACTSW1_02630 [Candidatus Hodarchaeales archaeon]